MDLSVDEPYCQESTRHVPGWAGASTTMELIEKGGSDRHYWRVTATGRSGGPETAIVMVYTANRPDNLSFFAATEVLAKAGARVPAVHHHDAARRVAWLEDLGRQDLWDHRESADRGVLYRSALREAARVHAIDPDRVPAGLAGQLQPPFDEALYQWEQEYFLKEFAARFSAAGESEREAVRQGPGLAALRRRLAALPRRMVHRDFQSQNVIIRNDEAWMIDYQGLRPGRPEYDLASLLYDPYVVLPEDERAELIAYAATLQGEGEQFGADAEVLAMCACQRLMQALGAYGKLGVGDGRTSFLRHVPNALRNLRGVLDASGLVPELRALLTLKPGAVEAAGGPPVEP